MVSEQGTSPRLLSLGEAAGRLGIKRKTLYAWASSPTLDFPVRRVGTRALRVPEDALMAWVEAQTGERAKGLRAPSAPAREAGEG